MNPKLKNIISLTISLGIGFFFIWLSLIKLTPDQKKDIIIAIRNANFWWVALAIPLGILSHFLRAIRWKMLIETMGYKPRNSNMFFAVMIGYFSNLALPRLGEVSRCTILTKYEDIPFDKSFGTVITERAFDMIVFIALFFFVIIYQADRLSDFFNKEIYGLIENKLHLNNLNSLLVIIVIVLIILFSILFLFFWNKIQTNKIFIKVKEIILGFVEGLKSLTKVKNLWLFGFYTFSIWSLYLAMAYIVFFSIPASSGLGIDAGLAVLVFGSIAIMIVQGGIGIYPEFVSKTLFLFQVVKTQGLALGWLIWTSQNLTIVVVGIISLILLPILNNRKNVKA
ncbi:MAG: lysylphosphatidylglycerol synthase transmembrane domain-containing protein [Bacteroidota bacterium]